METWSDGVTRPEDYRDALHAALSNYFEERNDLDQQKLIEENREMGQTLLNSAPLSSLVGFGSAPGCLHFWKDAELLKLEVHEFLIQQCVHCKRVEVLAALSARTTTKAKPRRAAEKSANA